MDNGIYSSALLASFAILMSLVLLSSKRRKIFDLKELKHGNSVRLSYSPNELTRIDLAVVVISVLRKYLPGAIQLSSIEDGFELPQIEINGPLRLNQAGVNSFCNAFGEQETLLHEYRNIDEMSPLFLVATTTPLLLVLLSHPLCPIRPLGAVNTRNAFNFVDSRICCSPETLLDASKKGSLSYKARIGGQDLRGVRRRRGVEFTVLSQILHNNIVILTQELHFLQFLPKHAKPLFEEDVVRRPSKLESKLAHDTTATHMTYRIQANAPRKWAASCKDYNPIHISNLAAKLFGFPSKIAHGNHVVAIALQAMLDGGVKFKRQASDSSILQWIDVRSLEMTFHAPVAPLPIDLQLAYKDVSPNEVQLEICNGPRTCIVASMTT